MSAMNMSVMTMSVMTMSVLIMSVMAASYHISSAMSLDQDAATLKTPERGEGG